ncbi:ATP-dependent DNA helicase PIF1 [Paramuricea clavata]|uniref:ATP-dependent DNA helicase PIF1 n=1 Tax=Paramuricea clavata TaxID=317549 RepID=A0A6S7KE50_PARCT|nr:ATP-dependent DNA helicase PIF1 [Paramuricea clavata]
MLEDILFHYLNMGASQFLKDFRMEYKVKKNAELRKTVTQRKEKRQEKNDSVPFKDIESDRSENKIVSHGRLVGFTNKYKDAGLCRVYNKSQLLMLCEAYGVRVTNRSNKTVLSNKLMEAITTHACIPFIYPVNDRQYTVVQSSEVDGQFRIRLRLTNAI